MPREPVPVASGRAAPFADAQRLPKGRPVIGLGADAGIPDGVMGSLVLRPAEMVRLQLGAGSNTASPGVRAGLSFLPLGTGPALVLEGGHYLAGDASGLARTFFSGMGNFSKYVGKVGYSFVNMHAGFDFEATRSFTFFIHGGVTYMRATLSELEVPADTTRQSSEGLTTTVTFREEPVLRMWTPSMKLGLVFFLQ